MVVEDGEHNFAGCVASCSIIRIEAYTVFQVTEELISGSRMLYFSHLDIEVLIVHVCSEDMEIGEILLRLKTPFIGTNIRDRVLQVNASRNDLDRFEQVADRIFGCLLRPHVFSTVLIFQCHFNVPCCRDAYTCRIQNPALR